MDFKPETWNNKERTETSGKEYIKNNKVKRWIGTYQNEEKRYHLKEEEETEEEGVVVG